MNLSEHVKAGIRPDDPEEAWGYDCIIACDEIIRAYKERFGEWVFDSDGKHLVAPVDEANLDEIICPDCSARVRARLGVEQDDSQIMIRAYADCPCGWDIGCINIHWLASDKG